MCIRDRECDVRGMTLEEAILAVDMFLDGATLNRLKMVYICLLYTS